MEGRLDARAQERGSERRLERRKVRRVQAMCIKQKGGLHCEQHSLALGQAGPGPGLPIFTLAAWGTASLRKYRAQYNMASVAYSDNLYGRCSTVRCITAGDHGTCGWWAGGGRV